MKVLLCGFNANVAAPAGSRFSPLAQSTPFGFDIVVVDTSNVSSFLGSNNVEEVSARWVGFLQKWLAGHHKLIVILQPQTGNNYGWLSLDGFDASLIQAVGSNSFIGSVVAADAYTKAFLGDHEEQFSVSSYYRLPEPSAVIYPNSQVDDGLLTSFSWKRGSAEVIFVPPGPIENIFGLANSLELGSSQWVVAPAKKLQAQINEIDAQINGLNAKKGSLSDELHAVNNKVNSLLSSDILLRRAINSYQRTQSTDTPNPQNFYEAIEAIEKAFPSERDMRTKLNVSSTKVGKVTQRAQDFRHVARDGQPPEELTEQEKN